MYILAYLFESKTYFISSNVMYPLPSLSKTLKASRIRSSSLAGEALFIIFTNSSKSISPSSGEFVIENSRAYCYRLLLGSFFSHLCWILVGQVTELRISIQT